MLDPVARSLNDPFSLGGIRVPNRVLLAPLAGIGNWFVRLQAKRYGAGMAVSEMVSSYAIHHRNGARCRSSCGSTRASASRALRGAGPGVDPALRPGPRGHALGGGGRSPRRARTSSTSTWAARCPKVCKTGAGAALLSDPERAVALARAAREGGGLPVTVKLRSGRARGDESGLELARRLVGEGGVSAIALHPRAVSERHRGAPDYELVARLVRGARRAGDPHGWPARGGATCARSSTPRARRR